MHRELYSQTKDMEGVLCIHTASVLLQLFTVLTPLFWFFVFTVHIGEAAPNLHPVYYSKVLYNKGLNTVRFDTQHVI